ncbi:MAG: MBL fold metallo-hydrolase [Clostridia bacterium]|nr:MBL fold metallo-hydrolase [Clostridia bacterium]
MKEVRIHSLYSGSTGNSFLIRSPKGCILIDAGKNAKRLCAALECAETSPDEIRAIFITHEHSDHIGALNVFLKKHPVPVHILERSAYALRNSQSVAPCLRLHSPLYTEQVCDMTITSFPTPHDSEGSVGYLIEIPTERKCLRIGYATDIGHVSETVERSLLGCDAVILESNHDIDMLHTGPYPYPLKQRIASRYGHLSNFDSAALAARLCATGTKSLMLAHLSQENNTPDLAFSVCQNALRDYEVALCVACPERVTELSMEGIL